jgi:RNA polymerase sigma-70 factor, ECF subfamily
MTGETTAIMSVRDPDVRLMVRVRDHDDRDAFAELVERFQNRVVSVLNHVIGHKDEAEDLAQEVFLRVYRTREKYTPKAKFSTWLYTIANNLALNSVRDRKRKPKQVIPNIVTESNAGTRPEEQLAIDREPQPGQGMQNEEMAVVVRKALDELNERQKMAIILNKFEDMGYQEIGDIMGLSMQAVKSLLNRAREQLRKTLQQYIDPDSSVPSEEN